MIKIRFLRKKIEKKMKIQKNMLFLDLEAPTN